MGSLGMASTGTLLKMGDGQASETFTTIAEVGDIDWSGLKMNVADITNQSSLSAFMERVGTVIDPGSISFPVNFIPTSTTQGYVGGLLYYLKNKTLKNFKIVFPDAATTTWTFSALITEFHPKAPVDGKLSADITLTLSGVPGFA